MIFRALKSRNYRLFFLGQGISLMGFWMTRVATSWLVYRLTGSAFWLGVTGFATQIPTSLAVTFAGVLIEGKNKRHILFVTQILFMILSLSLAVLALTQRIQVWHVILISLFQGLVHAFDIPARQSFVVEMVDRKSDLGNAVALNSTMFNGARLMGPALAALLMAFQGEWLCFLVDALSYLAVILSLSLMRFRRKTVSKSRAQMFQDFHEGFRYVFGNSMMRALLALVSLVSLCGMSYVVLLPVFSKKVFLGGSGIFGFLNASAGFGALAGALFLAAQRDTQRIAKIIPWAASLGGAGLFFFSFSQSVWLSALLIMISASGFMVQLAASNTLLQLLSDDDKRARVMSFYALSFLGMAPFGNLLAGHIAEAAGAPFAVRIGGMFCLLGALFFFRQISHFMVSFQSLSKLKALSSGFTVED